MRIKSKKELEETVGFYNFLKQQNSSIEGHLNIIELENLEGLSDNAWRILNDCGSVILKLDTCNGLSEETLKKLSLNKKITYQFVEDRNEDGYNIDDLFTIYNILETFKDITGSAENNIHKIVIVCNIITLLVWYDEKGNRNNKYSTDDRMIECRSLRGSLFSGRAVCHGYALVIKIILNYIGIETTMVGGYGLGDYHAWNQVKDDVFYNLDLTFDWLAFLNDLSFDNTLKSDEQFYLNHSIDVSWDDYTNLKKCPKSISNQDIRYYSKIIPEDLKRFLVENQTKGLYKILEYRQHFLNQEGTAFKTK